MALFLLVIAIAFSRLITSSCTNLGSEVFSLLDFNNILYGLYKNTSLSCTLSSFYFSLSTIISYGVL